jgi:uncharacterized membrane protein YfcA
VDILYFTGLALTGFAAGLLGALLGLGGGVFVVPALRLIFGLPFLTAIGTSNVAVIATSTAGAASYVRNRLANIRLALVLLTSTTAAALVSSLVASFLPVQLLSGLFAAILVYTAFSMRRGTNPAPYAPPGEAGPESPERLDLEGEYFDAATGKTEIYGPQRIGAGISANSLAGVVAGLLGVGGGIVQMPVMNLLMGVPLKVATGTSNFMIGITATGAALVRYANGDIDPVIAVPVALFVFLGARVGAWLVPRTPNALLRRVFSWVALIIAGLMLLQALGLYSATNR